MTKVAVCVQTGRKDCQGELDTHSKIFHLKIKSIDFRSIHIFKTKDNTKKSKYLKISKCQNQMFIRRSRLKQKTSLPRRKKRPLKQKGMKRHLKSSKSLFHQHQTDG